MSNAAGRRARLERARAFAGSLLRLAWIPMAAFGLFLWLLSASHEFDRLRGAQEEPEDYTSFVSAGKLVLDGRAGDLYDPDAVAEVQGDLLGVSLEPEEALPYFNPPYAAVIFAPLALLSLGAVSAVLFALNAALVVICGVALQKLVAPREPRHAVFLWVAYLSFPAVFAVFLHLQLSMLSLLAWLGFIHFQRRGEEAWSGAALALGLFKPQLIVLPVLFLCYRRRLAALAPLAGIGAVLLALSLAFAGPGVLVDYPRFLLDSTAWQDQGIYVQSMFSWNGLVADLTGDATPSSLLVGALSLPTLSLVLWAWWSCRDTWRDRLLPLMGLTLSGTLLINPHLYLHDMVLLCLALALAAAHSLRASGSPAVWWAVTIGFWALLLPLPGMQVRDGLPLLTLAMAGLQLYLCWELRRESSAAAKLLPATTGRLAA